jgi:hypothetical protein
MLNAMETSQALVAIGGKADRLKNRGTKVPVSKSFLTVNGRPLLFWSLSAIHAAGIRELVIAGNDHIHLHEAEFVLASLPFDFDNISFLRDPGLGVHGLPYQARRLLRNDNVLFECGHSIMTVEHYRRLRSVKLPNTIVLSGFAPHPSNHRQPVYLKKGQVFLEPPSRRWRPMAVAHPFLIDRNYIRQLPLLDFNIARIIAHYTAQSQLRYVLSSMPPEFDVPEELEASMAVYRRSLPMAMGQERAAAITPSQGDQRLIGPKPSSGS